MSRIFMIQTMILNRLGLKKQPNVTSNLPAATIDQFKERFKQMQQAGDNNPDEYFAKRFQAVPPSCQYPKGMSKMWHESGRFHLYFDLSQPQNTPDTETKVTTASIRLYKKPIIDCNCRRNHRRSEAVSASDTDDDDDDPEEDEDKTLYATAWQYKNKKGKKKFITTVALNKTQEGWVKITVKAAVETWLRKKKKNLGIFLTVKDSNDHEIDPFEVFDSFNCSEFNSSDSRPFPLTLQQDGITINDSLLLEANVTYPNLDILTVEVPKKKSDREIIRRKRDLSFQRGCFREKIYVSFAEDFGWNQWIIQPQGFETGFCRGSCSPLVNSTYLRGKYPDDETKVDLMQRECCGPTRFRPLSLLQMNEHGELTIVFLEDFIVAECGCRP